jgi:hypothetical protein
MRQRTLEEKNKTQGVRLDKEVIKMSTRHPHKPHHVISHMREWLHRCNPYA